MNDMTSVIQPKSDQLNADSLLGGPIVITITDVSIRPGTEQPVTINYQGDDGKPWKPCKSTSRCLVAAWGPDARQYIGRSAKLFCDPNVTWGGMKVGGIRISHLSHIEREMVIALTATKGKKVMATIKPLVVEAAATTASAPAPITLEQAELDVRAATTMDDLQNVWKRKVMAPHRDALTDLLNERKAELAFASAPAADPATSILTEIANEKTSDALDAMMARRRDETDALPPEAQETIRVAYAARFDQLSGGAA